jgi:hypothetical protein
VIPTLKRYSDIVSDIPSGRIYAIYILSDILSGMYSDILSDMATEIWLSRLRSGDPRLPEEEKKKKKERKKEEEERKKKKKEEEGKRRKEKDKI